MRYIERLRANSPLVFNITNEVVTNYVANGLLAIGASPAMSNAKEEAAEMARISQALALNIGTPSEDQVEAMLVAGQAAMENNIPIILDPVAVGATSYRKEIVQRLLKALSITVIRGNMAEIASLNNETEAMRGVDSLTDEIPYETVKAVANKYKTIVVATGKEDIISDGERVYTVANGHERLTEVTGSGCLLTAVVAAYASLDEDRLAAVTYAVSMYGLCAERAIKESEGVGSFKVRFLDELHQVRDDLVEREQRVSLIKGE